MKNQSKPNITQQFNPKTGKFEYITTGHIGSKLFKQIVFSDFYERIVSIQRTYENNHKVTRGFL